MKASKKCPHCGQWSAWTHNPSDRCDHCQGLLDPAAFERQQAQAERKEEEEKRFSVDLIQINPDDSALVKFFKSIGLGFQLAFVGIVSFILWLIALLAG
ncbi:hypothetical protein EFA69_09050 [Rufibacter immobilis]|uniref:Uncharacterized protein n=1 Tax=Rufibacter immobilis TaxID=1348778 RepID=A0A3M9MVY4_9BACT|nr:hypothetical protein [Rufibacter immobilis]RNI29694.1 hypothetical protein EFA69_09050 [Rufibacter immobilis]